MNEGMGTFVAPLTLVLGAGLLAAGILSIFDIHFFKNKTRGLSSAVSSRIQGRAADVGSSRPWNGRPRQHAVDRLCRG